VAGALLAAAEPDAALETSELEVGVLSEALVAEVTSDGAEAASLGDEEVWSVGEDSGTEVALAEVVTGETSALPVELAPEAIPDAPEPPTYGTTVVPL
jgi:hypothetical protein